MTFKDALAQDLTTFINVEEFGEIAELQNTKLKAIITRSGGANPASYTTKGGVNPTRHAQILHGEYITIYYKSAEMQTPQAQSQVWLNGRRYTVETALESAGITRLTLTAEEQPARLPRLFE